MAGEHDGADEAATQTSTGAGATIEEGAPSTRPGPTLGVVGRFRLEAKLGAGGMGDVYRAYDPMLDRAVALKVLRVRAEGDARPQQLRRILREARAAAALTHPNTVTIFDVGEADGEVFIAMELLDGESLRSVIRRPRGDFAQKMRWLKEAANALSAAHARGLVHRDVKPDNMFVCAPTDTLKLLDFGIAKREETEVDPEGDTAADSLGPSSLRTEMGVRVGTPRYMAPEQRLGLPTDARTDQFAWALVAFELLTGSHPLAAPATVTNPTPGAGAGSAPALTPENIRAALAKIPQVSKPLTDAIVRALDPLKEARFASMADLVAAIDAKEPTRTPWRWMAVAAFGLVGVAGVAGRTMLVKAKPPALVAVPPRCEIQRIRSIPIGEDDRVGALADGDIVIARDIRQGLTIERELAADGGAAPVSQDPMALMMLGMFEHKPDYDDLSLGGLRIGGISWMFAYIEQGFPRGPFIVGISDKAYMTDRITPPLSGLVMTAYGIDRRIIGVTTPKAGNRMGGLPDGAEVYISSLEKSPTPTPVEEGEAYAPSIATSADNTRIAFAYAMQTGEHQQALHLAILDETGQRVSDIRSLHTSIRVYSAVAFAEGARAAVFWVEDLGVGTRLRSATYAPGSEPTPTKNAVEESALSFTPVTARLPTGAWAAAWIGSPNGTPTLRVAPVTANGDLVGATSVATLPATVDGLKASASDRGITLSWREVASGGARMAKIAEVTCH